ncbi:MAG TPA: hypothetical protein EYP08_01615, partial [Pyrodictiaceae archaeon]|nr:hypothetical protein [Pyrodictiaceae archaeon]
ALLHSRQSGQGQVIDAAMVEGSALLTILPEACNSTYFLISFFTSSYTFGENLISITPCLV